QAEDGIRDRNVTGVQTCALPIYDLMSVFNHGITVSSLAYQVGEEMQLPKDQCYELAVAGVLHDIGKLRLSGYVSGKESPLVVERSEERRVGKEGRYQWATES